MVKEIFLPLDDTAVSALHAGDKILLTGEIYVARDAAHERIVSAIKNGGKPPFEIAEAVVYYAGPAPVKPGEIIGVIGPTTAGRMDAYTPFLLERGLHHVEPELTHILIMYSSANIANCADILLENDSRDQT